MLKSRRLILIVIAFWLVAYLIAALVWFEMRHPEAPASALYYHFWEAVTWQTLPELRPGEP